MTTTTATRFSRQATPREIRDHLKREGYEVRIDRWGQVNCRRNRDRFPGSPQVWLMHGWLNDYRWRDDSVIELR